MAVDFITKVSNKSFTNNDFPLLCDEYISISLSCNHDFIDLL